MKKVISTSDNDALFAHGDRVSGRVENGSSNRSLVVVHEREKVELMGEVDWPRDCRRPRMERRDLRMRNIPVKKVRWKP
jgi:hypothetical protein